MNPDPREARCRRSERRDPHIWRDRNFWPDGVTRCVICHRVKGERWVNGRRV